MVWLKRMILGGLIVNILYSVIMLLKPGLSIPAYVVISGSITGILLSFLIFKRYI